MPRNRNAGSEQVEFWTSQLRNEFVVSAEPSSACLWLQSQMDQLLEDTHDDPVALSPTMLVRFLGNRFKFDRTYLADGARPVLPCYWASPFDDISESAVAFGKDLIEVCRQVGGYDYGDAVANYIYAERRILEARLVDVFPYVWAPIYPVMQNDRNTQDMFRVGDVTVTSSFNMNLQLWDVEIRRSHGDHYVDRVVLSSPSIDRYGTNFVLRRAQFTVIEHVLTTLRQVDSGLNWRMV